MYHALCESEAMAAVEETINGTAARTLFRDIFKNYTFYFRNGVYTG